MDIVKSSISIISSLSIFFLLLSPFAPHVSAQNSEVEVTKNVRKEARLEVKNEIQVKNNERKASQEAKLQEAQKLRIRNQWRKLYLRLQAFVDRLLTLVERIDSRLSKFEEENPEVFTELIHADIDKATSLLMETQLILDEADGEMEDILDSEDPKGSYEEFRDSVFEIKSNLKEAHLLLVKSIGDIKGLRIGTDKEEDQ